MKRAAMTGLIVLLFSCLAFAQVSVDQAEEQLKERMAARAAATQALAAAPTSRPELTVGDPPNLQRRIEELERENSDLRGRLSIAQAEIALLKANAQIKGDGSSANEPPPASTLGKGFSVGDVAVNVVSAGSETIPLMMGGQTAGDSKDPLFVIRVAMRNHSDAHKADYQTWAPQFSMGDDVATLTDDRGNEYKRIDFGLYAPKGRLAVDSIYPGKELTDILVFELPVDSAKRLTLHLPKKNLGGVGEGVITIEDFKK